jgi:hypothetical protein
VQIPGWFAALSRFFPVTSAVASLYQVLIARQPVTAPWGSGGLVWLSVTAAAYLAADILAFRLADHAARTRGTLARY